MLRLSKSYTLKLILNDIEQNLQYEDFYYFFLFINISNVYYDFRFSFGSIWLAIVWNLWDLKNIFQNCFNALKNLTNAYDYHLSVCWPSTRTEKTIDSDRGSCHSHRLHLDALCKRSCVIIQLLIELSRDLN